MADQITPEDFERIEQKIDQFEADQKENERRFYAIERAQDKTNNLLENLANSLKDLKDALSSKNRDGIVFLVQDALDQRYKGMFAEKRVQTWFDRILMAVVMAVVLAVVGLVLVTKTNML